MATTAGERARTRALRWALGVTAVVATAGVGCGESSPMGSADPGEFDQAAMLANLSANIIQTAHGDFLTEADALVVAVTAWQSQVGSDTADDAREQARAAWRQAMLTWSRVEMMQIGPAAAPNAPGAEAMRDEIYSWVTVSPCSVDQQIVSQAYGEAGFIDNKLVNVYGLDALEYLLFYDGPDNQCASASSINRDGDWDAIAEDELTVRRAAYAVVVAEGIKTRAQALHDAWDPANGDFGAQLVAAASGEDSVYSNPGQAIDAVYAGMFYVDTSVKDAKLGRTTGLWSACATEECGAQHVESAWAQHSLENIVGNIQGFQLLYHGGDPSGDGLGFDDYLRSKDAGNLATEMSEAIEQALVVAQATPAPLVDTLSSSPADAEALYNAVKAITDLLKNEFAIVLQVTIPTVGKGDTD